MLSVQKSIKSAHSSQKYFAKEEAEMELDVSKKEAESVQELFIKDDASFGHDSQREDIQENQLNPTVITPTKEILSEKESRPGSARQFFDQTPAIKGDTAPPKSSYVDEPIHHIKNDDQEAFGYDLADGSPPIREGTPIHYFDDAPQTHGQPEDFNRELVDTTQA